MTFRSKLLLICSLTVTGSVALVTAAASVATRRAFERLDSDRRSAFLKQFEREVRVQGAELAARVENAAASQTVRRIAAEADRAEPDFASFYNSAQTVAETSELDFLDVTRRDLTILSSSYWPARFGYRDDWALCTGCDPMAPRLVRIPMPDGTTVVALAAARTTDDVLVIGARQLNSAFLKTLGEAPGIRPVLWLSPQEVFDADGAVTNAAALKPIVDEAMKGGERSQRVGDEAFLAVPLRERGQTMAVLLAASSLREQMNLERAIVWIGVWAGASGIVLGVLLSWRATGRITRPVQQLVQGARAVAAGDWSARVATSNDEIGQLGRAFNEMTEQLIEQRDRALQAERVAAWRELARRLAHELKNPLFPLQITIENLQRARAAGAEEFDDIFRESTLTLLEEVRGLQTIIGRFSEFAKMPAPQFEAADVNNIVRSVVKLHEQRLRSAANVDVHLELTGEDTVIEADPEQLHRAFGNLVLNAGDAMKQGGGTLTIRTERGETGVRIEFADTGEGLTNEERERLFTPYYTTKQHGTGLGLAIVQSVVTDHHGNIWVDSQPGKGAVFSIELPFEQGREAKQGQEQEK